MGPPSLLVAPTCRPGQPRKKITTQMCCYRNFIGACKLLGMEHVCGTFATHVQNFPQQERYLAIDHVYHHHGEFLILACAEYVMHLAKHAPNKKFTIAYLCPRLTSSNLTNKSCIKICSVLESQGVTGMKTSISSRGQIVLSALTSTIYFIPVENLVDAVKQKSFTPEIVICYEMGFIAQYSKAVRNAVTKLLERPGVISTGTMQEGDVDLLQLSPEVQKWIANLYGIPLRTTE